MKPWFVFFHLSFSFLLVNSFMRMSKLSRISIIGATLSLACYFTMTSPQGISWQIWASSIVLIHLINWNKQNLNEKKFFNDFESEIYDSYFSEYPSEQFDVVLDHSHWEEYSRVGSFKVSKDEIILKWSEESNWFFSYANSVISVQEKSLFFIIDINAIKEIDIELYQKIMLLSQSSNHTNIAS
jgi:hypothetical protein